MAVGVEVFDTTPVIPLFWYGHLFIPVPFLFGLPGAMHHASTVATVSFMNVHLSFILIDMTTDTSVRIPRPEV